MCSIFTGGAVIHQGTSNIVQPNSSSKFQSMSPYHREFIMYILGNQHQNNVDAQSMLFTKRGREKGSTGTEK